MNIFLKRYRDMGHEFDPEKIAIKQSIRVNTLKISEDDLIPRLKKKKVKLMLPRDLCPVMKMRRILRK